MKKIPTLFTRPEGSKLVTPEVREGCEWVINGEGVATVKWDGSCCAVIDGKFYARYQPKVAPTPEVAAAIGFIPMNNDGQDGHRRGWRLVDNSPADKYHREAWVDSMEGGFSLADWTYELIGPKVQGNPYKQPNHRLIKHGAWLLRDAPRTFEELREWLATFDHEGLVWWRDPSDPNSEKVKIKRRDFGYAW